MRSLARPARRHPAPAGPGERCEAGLEAVVSQEPVYDLYRYLYGDGIRRLNSVATPALYDLIDLTPGPVLNGTPPAVQAQPVAVQTNDGKWRAEQSWPRADPVGYTSPLLAGSYTDDGSGSATETSDTEGVWTISPRLPHDAHLSGSGRAIVDVATTRPNANLVVDVYDLDEFGLGPLITRQGSWRAPAASRRSTCGPPTGRSRPGTGSPCA